jgi:hypothetical protein
LNERFTPVAAALLRTVLEAAVAEVVEVKEAAGSLLARFNGVFLEDSTVVTLPDSLATIWAGCGGSGSASEAPVKVQVRWDLLRGGLDGPHLSDGRTHNWVAMASHGPLPAGSLRLADLGVLEAEDAGQPDHRRCFFGCLAAKPKPTSGMKPIAAGP